MSVNTDIALIRDFVLEEGLARLNDPGIEIALAALSRVEERTTTLEADVTDAHLAVSEANATVSDAHAVVKAAEAQVTRLQEALREIRDFVGDHRHPRQRVADMRYIADRVLSAGSGETTT